MFALVGKGLPETYIVHELLEPSDWALSSRPWRWPKPTARLPASRSWSSCNVSHFPLQRRYHIGCQQNDISLSMGMFFLVCRILPDINSCFLSSEPKNVMIIVQNRLAPSIREHAPPDFVTKVCSEFEVLKV